MPPSARASFKLGHALLAAVPPVLWLGRQWRIVVTDFSFHTTGREVRAVRNCGLECENRSSVVDVRMKNSDVCEFLVGKS